MTRPSVTTKRPGGVKLARLPAIDRLLIHPDAQELQARYGRETVSAALREAVAQVREALLDGAEAAADEEAILTAAAATLEDQARPSLKSVFNLTGTVLHTNLGRAPLPQAATAAAIRAAAGPCNLEFDLETGRRGERDSHLEPLLRRLTGAEAATVVNNNAAAVLLVLNTLALRREVLVSRGELIEIGGSFRLPEIMARAGAKLREVGTTNRTHLKDFAEALGPCSAAILKAQTSNYVVEGFTAAVPERQLAALAGEKGLPFIVDLGSGSLVDLAAEGLPREPLVSESLAAGADLVTFSGDKLLGGPQAGIIVGRADLIAKLSRNPLRRALRCDKMTIAVLETVLRLYERPEALRETLPTLELLTRPLSEIAALAEALHPPLSRALQGWARVEVVTCESQIGSGALPRERLASAGLRLTPIRGRTTARRLAAALRSLPRPVVGRIQSGGVILDLRCLQEIEAFSAQLSDLSPALAWQDGGG